MLMNVLGTLTAFISVILLLSIMVTATVQFIQSVLRLRARNLMKGLAQLIMKAEGHHAPEGLGWLKGEAAKAKRMAATLLNESNAALLNKVKDPTNWIHYWVLGPKVSWVKTEDIIEPAKKLLGNDESKAKQLMSDFERAGDKLKDRYQLIIRIVTFCVGLAIAFGFQVSAPQLFSNLSAQTEIQQKIAVDTDQLLNKIGKQLEENSAQKPGELAKTQAELSTQIEGLVSNMSTFKIGFWADKDFYIKRAVLTDADSGNDQDRLNISALIGVLVTAILLSLGAPFWYEQLRHVLRFRDMVSGETGKGEQVQVAESAGQSNQQAGGEPG